MSLNIIDAYLSEKNNESLIKEAIHMVKPYFFPMISDYLTNESSKVMKAFKADITAKDVLFFYMFNENCPEFRKSPIVDRI